jgi:hypothetical protein
LWLPDGTCPYRPPVYFAADVTTFFTFPGETGQQPVESTNLEGGNWCRFQSGDAWVTGYRRNGLCNGANEQSSGTFELFRPFVTTTCDNSCAAWTPGQPNHPQSLLLRLLVPDVWH